MKMFNSVFSFSSLQERLNETYSVIDLDWVGNGVWQAYNRPIYQYNKGTGATDFDDPNFNLFYIYSGSR